MRTPILFPVETINRELDYRIVLACLVADNHNRVFLGSTRAVNALIGDLPGSLYAGKNVFQTLFPTNLELYNELKRQKSSLLWLHEEGAVFCGSEDDYKKQLSLQIDGSILSTDDAIGAWGVFQQEYYSSSIRLGGPEVILTGHPRFDLPKEMFRPYWLPFTEQVAQDWAPFVLINTNLVAANPNRSQSTLVNPKRPRSSPEDQVRMTTDLCRQIAILAKRQRHLRFIIRSHPSESNQRYSDFFGALTNVAIIHDGPVLPWIQAASLVVHSGSTTGIESWLSDKPTIAFNPEYASHSRSRIANAFGQQIVEPEDLVDSVDSVLLGGADVHPEVLEDSITRMLDNLSRVTFFEFASTVNQMAVQVPRVQQSYRLRELLRRHRMRSTYLAGRRALGSLDRVRRVN